MLKNGGLNLKVLVVGGGGREHAIIQKLKENPAIDTIYCAPGNGGIALTATCVPIGAKEIEKLADFAQEHRMDYVVVTPDDPLCLGLVDLLAARGIPTFGPCKAAARLEGSKIFAKDLMRRYGIPTADYLAFDDYQTALRYVRNAACPMVIKADGLALGKGVLICHTRREAEEAVTALMQEGKFGSSGSRIVVEAFLQGPEVSVLCFTDGTTLRPMVSCMDHKTALNGDKGLNTGGMGVIAPNPFYAQDIAKVCLDTIFLPTLHAMRAEGCPFQGCLYFGLMLTDSGPKVIEYNCRFGDPEAQTVLSLLKSDLFTLMQATTNGTLNQTECRFSDEACCCVVFASGGYPERYETGKPIMGIPAAEKLANIFHAGTRLTENGIIESSGGRVLNVTATADTLRSAVKRAYNAASLITFEGMYMRTDIGEKALLKTEWKTDHER
ncbi:MAG: phosphoribosylamine--glycine ligase [Clostridia bacterium]|nr:phosphoribosylamine--glycine ligase [Clostridia bacterium]